MERALVSIVMPAFNAAATISEAIDSVLNQTYTDWELIIVNDGSSDSTASIARGYQEKDSRVRLLTISENRGVSEARNRGTRAANGDWIAFLDSDDIWEEDKLESQMRLVHQKISEGKSPDIVFTGSAFMDHSGKVLGYQLEVPETITYHELLKQNVISCSSVLTWREMAQKYPMECGNLHEDYAVWLKILRDGGHAYGINRPLLKYRLSAASRSGDKRKAAAMTYRVYRHMGLNLAQSFYYFTWYAFRNMKKYVAIARSGDNTRFI